MRHLEMVRALENLAVADGDPVRTEHIPTALTAGSFALAAGHERDSGKIAARPRRRSARCLVTA
jgi:hypothetical protein